MGEFEGLYISILNISSVGSQDVTKLAPADLITIPYYALSFFTLSVVSSDVIALV